MEKIIIYGLGKNYRLWKAVLIEHYEIVGYCDTYKRNLENVEYDIHELPYIQNEYDFILVTSLQYSYEITEKLLTLGISENKIKVISQISQYSNCWGGRPLVECHTRQVVRI